MHGQLSGLKLKRHIPEVIESRRVKPRGVKLLHLSLNRADNQVHLTNIKLVVCVCDENSRKCYRLRPRINSAIFVFFALRQLTVLVPVDYSLLI
jgi:hypothetical protein